MLSFVLFLILFSIICIAWFTNRPWWVRVTTGSPKCTYYFGPFNSAQEAQANHQGHIDDLVGEGAEGIEYTIEKGRPKQLTIEN